MPAMLPKGKSIPIAAGLDQVNPRLKWDAAGDLDLFVVGRDVAGKVVMLAPCGHPLESQNGGKAPAISGYPIAPDEFGNYPNAYGVAVNPFAAWVLPSADARDGAKGGWDEETTIFLSKVPADIVRLDLLVAINPQNEDGTPNMLQFAQVENVECELADKNGATLVAAKAEFQKDMMWGIQGVWFASLTRETSGWKFHNVMYAEPKEFGYYNDFQDQVYPTIPASNIK